MVQAVTSNKKLTHVICAKFRSEFGKAKYGFEGVVISEQRHRPFRRCYTVNPTQEIREKGIEKIQME